MELCVGHDASFFVGVALAFTCALGFMGLGFMGLGFMGCAGRVVGRNNQASLLCLLSFWRSDRVLLSAPRHGCSTGTTVGYDRYDTCPGRAELDVEYPQDSQCSDS